jgi:hypothetical protein
MSKRNKINDDDVAETLAVSAITEQDPLARIKHYLGYIIGTHEQYLRDFQSCLKRNGETYMDMHNSPTLHRLTKYVVLYMQPGEKLHAYFGPMQDPNKPQGYGNPSYYHVYKVDPLKVHERWLLEAHQQVLQFLPKRTSIVRYCSGSEPWRTHERYCSTPDASMSRLLWNHARVWPGVNESQPLEVDGSDLAHVIVDADHKVEVAALDEGSFPENDPNSHMNHHYRKRVHVDLTQQILVLPGGSGTGDISKETWSNLCKSPNHAMWYARSCYRDMDKEGPEIDDMKQIAFLAAIKVTDLMAVDLDQVLPSPWEREALERNFQKEPQRDL